MNAMFYVFYCSLIRSLWLVSQQRLSIDITVEVSVHECHNQRAAALRSALESLRSRRCAVISVSSTTVKHVCFNPAHVVANKRTPWQLQRPPRLQRTRRSRLLAPLGSHPGCPQVCQQLPACLRGTHTPARPRPTGTSDEHAAMVAGARRAMRRDLRTHAWPASVSKPVI